MGKYEIHDFLRVDIPITQGYGNDPEYYKQFSLRGHEGVDFGTLNGTEFFAPFDGKIVREGINIPGWKNYGEFIVVWDPNQRIALWFCHLQDFTKKVGDEVKQGELLGHTNNTGNTKGPHVHVNFCETDGNGNRINTDNGMLGFLDLMDATLVSYPWLPLVQPQVQAAVEHIQPAIVVGREYTQDELHPELFNVSDGQHIQIEGSTNTYVAHVNANGTRSFSLYVAPITTAPQTVAPAESPVAPVDPKPEDPISPNPVVTSIQPTEPKVYTQSDMEKLQEKVAEAEDVTNKFNQFVSLGYNTVDDVTKELAHKDTVNRGYLAQIIELKKQLLSNHQEDLVALEEGARALDELKDIRHDYDEVRKAIKTPKPDLFHVLGTIDHLRRLAKRGVDLLEEKNTARVQQNPQTQATSSLLKTISGFLAIGVVAIFICVAFLIGGR